MEIETNISQESKKKKSYGKGVFTGFFWTFVVMTILLIVMRMSFQKDMQALVNLYNANVLDETNISVRLGQKMNAIEDLIADMYYEEIDWDAMEEDMLSAMVDSLGDKYSVYYTEDEYTELRQSVTGTFKGVGIVVTVDEKNRGALIVQTYDGGSAKDAGLLPNDIICGVNGEDVAGLDISLITAKIKASENDKVAIKIYRESTDCYYEYELELRDVTIPTVEYEMLEDQIGYIAVSQFSGVTGEQFLAAIEALKEQHMKGLVIDLRNNTGGDLITTTEMLDLLLPEGMITYTKGKDGTGTEFKSDAGQIIQMPMALLVNGHSASASEVFSGALKDYGLATLVGETTFGKGIVQSLMSLGDGSALKLTVSHYYTPNGICIHGVGIEPDIKIPLDTELLQETGEDNQLQEALRVVKEQLEK